MALRVRAAQAEAPNCGWTGRVRGDEGVAVSLAFVDGEAAPSAVVRCGLRRETTTLIIMSRPRPYCNVDLDHVGLFYRFNGTVLRTAVLKKHLSVGL